MKEVNSRKLAFLVAILICLSAALTAYHVSAQQRDEIEYGANLRLLCSQNRRLAVFANGRERPVGIKGRKGVHPEAAVTFRHVVIYLM